MPISLSNDVKLNIHAYAVAGHQVFKPYTKGTLHERNIDMLWAAQTLGLGLGSGSGLGLGLGLWLGLGFNMHEHEHVPFV